MAVWCWSQTGHMKALRPGVERNPVLFPSRRSRVRPPSRAWHRFAVEQEFPLCAVDAVSYSAEGMRLCACECIPVHGGRGRRLVADR